VIRVASQMRVNGEPRPKDWGLRHSLQGAVWSIYHFGFVARDNQAPLLDALSPADHLASFRWLFPEDDLPEGQGKGAPTPFDYLYVLAQLEEHAGDRAGALASYRRLLAEAANKKYDSTRAIKMIRDAHAAVRRLSS
jgi:hypothetical protein